MAVIAARRAFASLVTKSLSSAFSSSCSNSLSSRSRFALALLNTGLTDNLAPAPVKILTRPKTSGSGYSPLNDPAPNWSNRPPKETILLDGCDYEHWLIVMEFPKREKPSESELIDAYVKTLASVVSSEEEARKKIYSVCTTIYTGFGALISEELSYKLKELPGVIWVLPDSYLDVPNKDYGGDIYVDGKVIHRPQYTSPRQQQPMRPRRRYDRRRETMQVERREPIQRQSSAQAQPPPEQQGRGQSPAGHPTWGQAPPGHQTWGQPSATQQTGQELPPGKPPFSNS